MGSQSKGRIPRPPADPLRLHTIRMMSQNSLITPPNPVLWFILLVPVSRERARSPFGVYSDTSVPLLSKKPFFIIRSTVYEALSRTK
jgi:hypothetical protein